MSTQRALERIRKAKLGLNEDSDSDNDHLDEEYDDDADIYEEVTEQEYQNRRVKNKVLDDFVIDDENGTSEYIDRGQDEWAQRSEDDYTSEEEDPKKKAKKTKEDLKLEKEEKKRKKKEAEAKKKNILSMFANQVGNSTVTSQRKDAKITEEDEALMNQFLMESTDSKKSYDEPILNSRKRLANDSELKKNPSNKLQRKSLASILSNQKTKTVKIVSPITHDDEDLPDFSPYNDNDNDEIVKVEDEDEESNVKCEPMSDGIDVVEERGEENVTFDDSEVMSEGHQQQQTDLLEDDEYLDADEMDYGDFDVNEIDSIERVMSLSQKTQSNVPSPMKTPIKTVELPKKTPSVLTPGSWADVHKNFDFQQDSEEFNVSDRVANLGFTSKDCIQNVDGENVLDIWWFDAAEMNDKVCIFGKVAVPNQDKNSEKINFVSTCVIVENIERNLFFLPRQKVSEDGTEFSPLFDVQDVYNEFNELRHNYEIKSFESSTVSRKYCLGKFDNIPNNAEYLKVMYPFTQKTVPHDLTGKTFSHVFGTSRKPLEMLLLKRKMMGPGWLRIKAPTSINIPNDMVSYCSTEFICDDPKNIRVLSDSEISECNKVEPPLVVMGLSIKNIMNKGTSINEVAAVSALVYSRHKIDSDDSVLKPGNSSEKPQQFSAVRPLTGASFPKRLPDVCRRQKCALVTKQSERELLTYLLDQLNKYDPDIIVGHNFNGFDLDILLSRMRGFKISSMSVLGRIKRTQAAMGNSHSFGSESKRLPPTVGRLVCDTYVSSREAVKAKDFSLTTLAMSELNIRRPEPDPEAIRLSFLDADKLVSTVQACMMDSWLVLALTFKLQFLPLNLQLTKLAGNLFSRTLAGAKANRNDHLLMHEFHSHKYILPDKIYEAFVPASKGGKKNSKNNNENSMVEDVDENEDKPKKVMGRTRGKPQYSGGLVLEPKSGFYDDYICLLDFNSLYPSIIQEFNICFTTVDIRGYNKVQAEKIAKEGSEDPDYMPNLPDPELGQGILPSILQTLVRRRREVKKLMVDPSLSPEKKANFNIRQTALKLTANSMYGCLGYAQSLFYAQPLAKLVTHMGREILQSTVDLAESQSLEVIYGDTDSIMVNTHSKDISVCKSIGNEFKKLVNQRYKLLELDIDGFFQRMLLSTKKKYAALIAVEQPDGAVKTHSEVKGLDLVRRDWCALTHDISKKILDELFGPTLDREVIITAIHSHLANFAADIRASSLSATGARKRGDDDNMFDESQGYSGSQKKLLLGKFIIYKNLSRDPEAYSASNSLPHVSVALRMKKQGLSAHKDDTIPYVMVQRDQDDVKEVPGIAAELEQHQLSGKDSKQPIPVHPDEALKYHLELDAEWYLSNQILQPVLRLCETLDGTDSHRIIEYLGLKVKAGPNVHSSYKNQNNNGESLFTLESQIPDSLRFADVHKFGFTCPKCGDGSNVIESPIRVVNPGANIKAENNIKVESKIKSEDEDAVKVKSEMSRDDENSFSVIKNPVKLESSFNCTSCENLIGGGQLINQLVHFIRREIRKFCESWMICDEPGCGLRTRSVSVFAGRCPSTGCKGTMRIEYTEKALYTELMYLNQLFDADKQFTKLTNGQYGNGDNKDVSNKEEITRLLKELTYADYIRLGNVKDMKRLQLIVKQFLSCSSRGIVDLSKILRFAIPQEQ